jgi:hypothetical protein
VAFRRQGERDRGLSPPGATLSLASLPTRSALPLLAQAHAGKASLRARSLQQREARTTEPLTLSPAA